MKISPRVIAIATLLVHWGPFNSLSYAWGFLVLLFVLFARPDWFRTNGKFSRRIIAYVLLFSGVFLLSALVNAFGDGASLNNFLWSIATYGSSLSTLVVLLVLPFREEDGPAVFQFSLYLTIFEALVGYLQMLAAHSFHTLNPFSGLGPAAGDLFVGTTFDIGIGNLVAIKMSITALLFIPFWFAKRDVMNTSLLFVLLAGWILPSAIYTLLIGFIVIIFFFVFKGSLKSILTLRLKTTLFYSLIAGSFLLGAFAYTQRENVAYAWASLKLIYGTASNERDIQTSRKVTLYKEALTKLPAEYPRVPWIGVGPGNYCSRSAWLVSGEYLEHQPDYIPVTPSPVAKKYLITLWSRKHITEAFKGAGSITNQPFSTWLSIYAEMGLFALLLFCMIMWTTYSSFIRAQNEFNNSFYGKLALGLKMVLVYFLILFFVDNLFEWPLVMAQFFVFVALLTRHIENAQLKKNGIEA